MHQRFIKLIPLICFVLFFTLVFQNPTSAATTRFAFSMKDNTGKAYNLNVVSDKETKSVVNGDTIYSGKYYFTVNGKKQQTPLFNNMTIDINTRMNAFYKVPSTAASYPDIVVVPVYAQMNIYETNFYSLINGQVKKATFQYPNEKAPRNGTMLTHKVKLVAPGYYQTVMHNSTSDIGWYFHLWKLDTTTMKFSLISTFYYGDAQDINKKGNQAQGQALITRYTSEPSFFVGSIPGPKVHVIQVNTVSVLAAPGGKAITTAKKGETLTILGEQGLYYKITYKGKQGYVLKSALTPPPAKLIIDKNFLNSIKNKKIPGFNLSIGMTRDQVIKNYGKVVSKGSVEGGDIEVFQNLPHVGIGFNTYNGDKLHVVRLTSERIGTHTFQTIKAALGKPNSEGPNEMEGGYLLFYKVGDIEIFIQAKDTRSPVTMITIINKGN